MSVATIAAKPTLAAYPTASVESKLRAELLETVEANATLHGSSLPADLPSRCAAAIHIDSLSVVEMLCSIDRIVGFELKEDIVRSGGYSSINDALRHVLPRIEAAWNKHGVKK